MTRNDKGLHPERSAFLQVSDLEPKHCSGKRRLYEPIPAHVVHAGVIQNIVWLAEKFATGGEHALTVIVTAFEEVLKPYLSVQYNFYDVSIVVITFIALGKYLEAKSKLKTGDAIEILQKSLEEAEEN